MSLSPQKFRELVFQLLYSRDAHSPDPADMQELMMAQLEVPKKAVRLAQDRLEAVLKELPDIDNLIASASTSYEFERIQMVTKNILRLAVYELNFDKTIPPKVVIAEAMRLSRKFGAPESASFVNAVLDHLHQKDAPQQ